MYTTDVLKKKSKAALELGLKMLLIYRNSSGASFLN